MKLITKQQIEAQRKARKKAFIKELAQFLAGDQGMKSIALQVEDKRPPTFAALPKWASEWAKVKNSSPLFGYLTTEEAEKQLTEFLK